LRGRDGSNREIGPPETKAHPTDWQTSERRHDAAEDHSDPRRNAEIDLQDCRGIGAEPKKGGVTERELFGVASDKIPSDADKGKQQDANENVDRERVRHHQGQGEKDGRQYAQKKR
jgi:hypothetical protein